MVGQDKVLLQLERNRLTRRDNSENTDFGRCSGLPYGSERHRRAFRQSGPRYRLALHRCWTQCLQTRLAGDGAEGPIPSSAAGVPMTGSSTEDHQ